MGDEFAGNGVKDRFKEIMNREKISVGAFAENIGVAQATVSHILNGRNKYPSTEVILRLHQRYPEISLEWLLTGKRNMYEAGGESDGTEAGTTMGCSLSAENAENPGGTPLPVENRKEMALEMGGTARNMAVKQEVTCKKRPAREITEIRIFFDDNTYETFRPEK